MPDINRFAVLGALSTALLGGTSHASLIFTDLFGLEGRVNVTEDDHVSFVDYRVDVLDGSSVAAFAVSNGNGPGPGVTTTRPGWSAVLSQPVLWDIGVQITGASSGVSFNTASIAPYSTLFGSDPLVSIFYFDDASTGGPIDEASDEVFEFRFIGDGDSEFVALAANGSILDASLFVIPEPASVAMLALGGATLAAYRRR